MDHWNNKAFALLQNASGIQIMIIGYQAHFKMYLNYI